MATLTIGFSVTPSGTGAGDDRPDPSIAHELTLTNGNKVVDATVSVPASTPTSDTVVWASAQHGVSTATAAVDVALVTIDPAGNEDTSLEIGISALYTTVSSTGVTTGIWWEQLSKELPRLFPGTVRIAADVEAFLTKIVARNRNTGTNDAVNVRVQAWG